MGTTNFDTLSVDAISGELTFTASTSRTTTADGTGTGLIADGGMFYFVDVTSGGTSTILTLPTPTPGSIVMLGAAGTAYELRSSAPSTVGINGGTGANAESAIAANTTVFAFCDAATNWTAWSMIAGTTFGAVEAAA